MKTRSRSVSINYWTIILFKRLRNPFETYCTKKTVLRLTTRRRSVSRILTFSSFFISLTLTYFGYWGQTPLPEIRTTTSGHFANTPTCRTFQRRHVSFFTPCIDLTGVPLSTDFNLVKRKVISRQIWRIWRIFQRSNVFVGRNLPPRKCLVSSSIVLMKN